MTNSTQLQEYTSIWYDEIQQEQLTCYITLPPGTYWSPVVIAKYLYKQEYDFLRRLSVNTPRQWVRVYTNHPAPIVVTEGETSEGRNQDTARLSARDNG